MVHAVECEVAGRALRLETGRVARLADGAVWATYGDTVILATVVASRTAKPDQDFLPLTVNYLEKAYSAGKIPGGYFKREGAPSEKEVLTSRLIDRPIRPLIPAGFCCETQIIASVLSVDHSMTSEIVALTAASAALAISDVPFGGPLAGVRIGRVGDRPVVNPSMRELKNSALDLVVAGTGDAIMMVEAGANQLSESVMLEALDLAHAEIRNIVATIEELQTLAGRPKRLVPVASVPEELPGQVRALAAEPIREAVCIADKTERQQRFDQILTHAMETLGQDDPGRRAQIKSLYRECEYQEVRAMILEKQIRADGRGPADIRPITCATGLLPRAHGSALFTRGETQSLAVVTLGTTDDEQRIDALEGEYFRTFMLHYNFPPFSVGETRPLRSPGRREVGHGKLAARALQSILPGKEAFPYTIRIVSDILESNGSSSMATVCGGALALMDAGVPITEPVAGIAMGLIKDGDRVLILSDILGLEDHLGDMDFKVTGTRDGVTALQMDIKIKGITTDLMRQALEQARVGRLHILDTMRASIAAPRASLAPYAPRIFTLQIKTDKIRDVIGPGGKVIRGIIAECGVKVNVNDAGLVTIAAVDEASATRAIDMINKLTEEVEVGKTYQGKVRKIVEFGAFVEILPNVDGLVHISQLAPHRVKSVADELAEGEEVLVKVLEVDRQGKIRLSRKDAIGDAEQPAGGLPAGG